MKRLHRLVVLGGFVLAGVVMIAGLARVFAQETAGQVILDMDTNVFKVGEFTDAKKEKRPAGAVELVEGKFAKACKFTFPEGARGGFIMTRLKPTDQWDAADGFSFWVKGDGSANFAGLELIHPDDYKLRYGYCFPLDSTQWRKIVVPWRDMIPEHPAGKLVDAKTGMKPSQFANLWFGKWFYWRQYPAVSYAVDQIALEKTIDMDRADYTPKTPGTPRLLARLKAREPVTIVAMGDSLSDKRHWANRQTLWSELVAKKLKETYGGEVRLVSQGIGGNHLSHNLVLMPMWLKQAPKPDLVTVWFGYNDWTDEMRGEAFKERLRFAVDLIRRETRGAAEVLLMTTCPAYDRWDEMNELAEAARVVAKEKNTALADVASVFHKLDPSTAGSGPSGRDAARKDAYWCSDNVHLGAKGHDLVSDAVLKAIQ
jgi:lysophospholipase L1-like esterase